MAATIGEKMKHKSVTLFSWEVSSSQYDIFFQGKAHVGHSQRFISSDWKPSQPCDENKILFRLFGFEVAHQSVHIAWMSGRKKVSFSQQTQNWGWITILNHPLVFYSITTTAYDDMRSFEVIHDKF